MLFPVFHPAWGVLAIFCTCGIERFPAFIAYPFETFFNLAHYTLGSTRVSRQSSALIFQFQI
jgi:hypothetical protein